MNRMNPKIMN